MKVTLTVLGPVRIESRGQEPDRNGDLWHELQGMGGSFRFVADRKLDCEGSNAVVEGELASRAVTSSWQGQTRAQSILSFRATGLVKIDKATAAAK